MTEPIRVGILNDMAGSAAEAGPRSNDRFVRLALDPLIESGRIDREVELVHAYGLGLPTGTAAAVERAFAELAAADVLVVLGPAIGDNALVATPIADLHRLPTINWAGTERARSEWMFHLQVGSHEDESVLLARELAVLGARRVAVIYDRSPIGRRYFSFLQAECESSGIELVATCSIAPLAEDATDIGAAVAAAAPDAVVYLGLGLAAPPVARAVTSLAVPKLMNTAGLRGYAPGFAADIDEWIYVDMVADDNEVLAELRNRIGEASGFGAAYAYDMGQLLGEGIARAPELTREGIRAGLELIKWIPAAEGHRGTLLGFGHHDRGALHGRYLVLRQWQGGASVQR